MNDIPSEFRHSKFILRASFYPFHIGKMSISGGPGKNLFWGKGDRIYRDSKLTEPVLWLKPRDLLRDLIGWRVHRETLVFGSDQNRQLGGWRSTGDLLSTKEEILNPSDTVISAGSRHLFWPFFKTPMVFNDPMVGGALAEIKRVDTVTELNIFPSGSIVDARVWIAYAYKWFFRTAPPSSTGN